MTDKEKLNKFKRKLERLKAQLNDLEKEHIGNELKFTYWGGYNMGYIKGKIAQIEDIFDELEI